MAAAKLARCYLTVGSEGPMALEKLRRYFPPRDNLFGALNSILFSEVGGLS